MNKVINKKEKGSFTIWICGALAVGFAFMVIFLSYVQTKDSTNAQDSLYFANTSAYKYVDKKLLGENIIEVVIGDPEGALKIFKDNLRANMKLDSNFNIGEGRTISGKVQIKDFIIYNVYHDKIEVFTFNGVGLSKSTRHLDEEVITPNGYKVVATTMYTSIIFDVDKLFGEKESKEIKVGTDILNYNDK